MTKEIKHFKSLFKTYKFVGNHPYSRLIKYFLYESSDLTKVIYIDGVSSELEDVRLLLWNIECGYRSFKSVTTRMEGQLYKLYIRTYV